MAKRLCFLYTETNGLHQTHENVSKKNIYAFARLVVLNYEIGIINNGEYNEEFSIKQIIKPRCMIIPEETVEYHGITQSKALKKGLDPEVAIYNFLKHLQNVDIIISHSIDFHLKTIIAEAIRYNIIIDFNKFVIIDTISFHHKFGYLKLKDLATELKIKEIPEDNQSNCELIRDIFFKLYSKFKKSLLK